MRKKDLYSLTLDYLQEHCPQQQTELYHENAFQLLTAVILSAQCTDERVNMVTPKLFEIYPDAHHMAQATPEEVYPLIQSISYPNSKAGYLVSMARQIISDYNGQVPSTTEELTRLSGVGRKTANVIQAIVFQKAALAVDTHVYRVSHRIGLVPSCATTPLAVEKELLKHIPQYKVANAHFWLLYHGRYVCRSRHPLCQECGLVSFCSWYRKKINTSH